MDTLHTFTDRQREDRDVDLSPERAKAIEGTGKLLLHVEITALEPGAELRCEMTTTYPDGAVVQRGYTFRHLGHHTFGGWRGHPDAKEGEARVTARIEAKGRVRYSGEVVALARGEAVEALERREQR